MDEVRRLAASSGNDLPIPGKHLPPVDYFTIDPCGQWTVRAHAKMGRLAVMLLRPVTMCLVLLPVMASCFTEVSLVSFVRVASGAASPLSWSPWRL